MAAAKKGLVLALVALTVALVGCDGGTKRLAAAELKGRPAAVVIPGILDLSYAENRDSAFGLLRSLPYATRRPLLVAVAAAELAFLALLWARRRRAPFAEQLGYALCAAGAAGNLLDRAALGYVVDFVHLHGWPIFNAADAYLLAGVALLALALLRPARGGADGAPAGPGDTPARA